MESKKQNYTFYYKRDISGLFSEDFEKITLKCDNRSKAWNYLVELNRGGIVRHTETDQAPRKVVEVPETWEPLHELPATGNLTGDIVTDELIKAVETRGARSAWERGVNMYCYDLIDNITDHIKFYQSYPYPETYSFNYCILNGAETCNDYSYRGNALICDEDIAERLCSPSRLKQVNGGKWAPCRGGLWLDVQARAVYQAYRIVKRAYKLILMRTLEGGVNNE